MDVPETHYADADGTRIAYQKFGSGPPLLIVSGLLSNVEISWEHELYRRTLERLGRHMTCVLFDKRGIGLSDRFDGAPNLEQRIGDIACVMDAVGWERAHLHGTSEGGLMAQLFAAEHPHRVESLSVLNSVVSMRYRSRIRTECCDGDPEFPGTGEVNARFSRMADLWPEDTKALVDWFIPSQSDNDSVIRWFGRLQRLSASPKDFRRQLESIFVLDGGDAAERIQCRTQVLNARGDRVIHVANGRLLAKVIPEATHVVIEGDDHFSWCMPNWRTTVDTILEFYLGHAVEVVATRRFATVLFTDIVNSTRQSASVGDTAWRQTLDAHDRITRELIDRHGGRVVKSTGDGLLAVFDLPSQGVTCGSEMVRALTAIGLSIRAGLHAGEIEVRDDGDITGIAVNLAARVEQQAGEGELWASSTVRDMMLGGSVTFDDRGHHELKGIDDRWHLYSVGAP